MLFRSNVMYKNLLVPTDGSPLSTRTANDAIKLARKLGARITVFYAAPAYHVEVYGEYIPPDLLTPREHAAAAKKTAQHYLDGIASAAAKQRVKCTGDFVISDATADAIVKAARKHKCDLIYMGSHGRTGISKLLLGSQTSKVLALARIPVLVHR